ncbi:MAG: N-6 DNA methylase [Acidobacteriaceae bacterium]
MAKAAKSSPPGPDDALRNKIGQIIGEHSGERDIYPYIRDLLTSNLFGIGLDVSQVAVDSPVMGVRDAPDIAVYLKGDAGQPIRTADHCLGVIEVKEGDVLRTKETATLAEKRKYVQTGTKAFYLCDQVRIIRWTAPALHDRVEFLWSDLHDRSKLMECFGPISADRATLRTALDEFRSQGEPYAVFPIAQVARHRFIDTIRSAVSLIVAAVGSAVDRKIVPDLKHATEAVERMAAKWGTASIKFPSGQLAIDFERWLLRNIHGLTPDEVRAYNADRIQLSAEIGPAAYALEIEHDLLQGYAARMGIEGPVSLQSARKTGSKYTDSGKAVESFVYETSSLIISRMLMIRFSEDNGFLRRMISNGGIKAFSGYATHFGIGMQALMRETYRHVRPFYTNLFAEGPLDWVLQSEDEGLSDAVLHAMYLLNRWDFSNIEGDILSGVYDHYLDLSRRRALGEVFTRPEIADYILTACAVTPTSEILDPACGSGTFLVQRLSREIKRLNAAKALDLNSAIAILGRIYGLDINPFSVTLAQMQILWHLLDLFKTVPLAEVPIAARRIVAAIRIEGGHTSLETFGTMPAIGAQDKLDLDVRVRELDNKLLVGVTQRFKMIATGTYDAVVGNPPYVRSHRSSLPEHIESDYSEVMVRQADLYVAFVFRAMRYWVKPGGRLGFIVPIAFLTADYAAELREFLVRFRIVEIVDFEALRKITFRGVKRPTVTLVIENTPGADEDLVKITTVALPCYDKALDHVDLSKAVVSQIPRRQLMSSRYHGTIGAVAEQEAEAA